MEQITDTGAGATLTKQLLTKLPDDLHQKAKEKSKRTGVSISFIVRKRIEEWVSEKDERPGEQSKKQPRKNK